MKSCSSKYNFDYKALPMPKFDDQQEKYLTQPDDITLLFNVPASVSDPDLCGFIWNLGGLRDLLKDNYATSRKNNFASNFEKKEKSALSSM